MMTDRWVTGRALRMAAADRTYSGALPDQVSNGEENSYPYVANYSKGLPHDSVGLVDTTAYRLLLRAVGTGRPEDFERIPLGGVRRLVNPQAGLAFHAEGPDSQGLVMPPAPRIDSPQNSSEMAELYWMALARDVEFTNFATDSIVAAAADDLTNNFTDFRGPKIDGMVTPDTLFRGDTPGDLAGPYISQFLLKDIRYGTFLLRQRQGTVAAGVDHLTTFAEWLSVQNGAARMPNGPDPSLPARYIQTPRDLASYVHFDALYEAYLNALLILISINAPFDAGNPYNFSSNQQGGSTYGVPHILTLVAEVATRAMNAVFFQKWFVHRRLRPEEFGGRIEACRLGLGAFPMIDQEILDSPVLETVLDTFGSHLLAQAYTEGSPTHPSYGAAHAAVAVACVTTLKAWFDESFVIPDPVIPNAAGTGLEPAPGDPVLTLGDELNKLIGNMTIGRNMAGVHWRTDYSEAVKLGEAIAIGILRDQKQATNEDASFTITRLDGTTITI